MDKFPQIIYLSENVFIAASFLKYVFLIFLFIWLLQVLVAACGIFELRSSLQYVESFSCGIQTLSCGMWDQVS